MLPDGRRLGAHLPLGNGMVRAVDRAHEIGAGTIQIFGDNPTAWRRRAEPPREQAAFRQRLLEHDIGPIAIHAAYLVNLAGPEPDFFERSVAVLTNDLRLAPGFAARFVNVHVGSHRDSGVAAGTRRLAEGVARVLDDTDDGPDAATHLDRHEHLGAGRIGEAGMAHILLHPRLAHAAYYLETPGMDAGYDAINMARARALAVGEHLAPLPPGAMNLRGSRARMAPAQEAEVGPGEDPGGEAGGRPDAPAA